MLRPYVILFLLQAFVLFLGPVNALPAALHLRQATGQATTVTTVQTDDTCVIYHRNHLVAS